MRLYAQLGSPAEVPDEVTAKGALESIIASPLIELLIAEVQGEVAATVTLVMVPNLTHQGRPWAQIENMVVEEAWRRGGVGKRLLDWCLDRAREAGCYKVQLQSANSRTGAHRFYESFGFAASSVGFRLYLD